MNTIADQWALFEGLFLPKSAGPEQRKDMRIAFFAGAESCMRVLHRVGDNGTSEDAGAGMLEGVHQELRLFAATMAPAGDAAPVTVVRDDRFFRREGGIWFYEDPTHVVANVRGRGETKDSAFKHWTALTAKSRQQ